MSIKLSELFGSMDEAFNNQKLEEMFNKTKDVAENMSKKSAERLEEITDCANAIADNKEKIQLYTAEIEKAKAEFNESMANMAKKTKEAFSVDNCTKNEVKADSVEVVEATAVEDENGKE